MILYGYKIIILSRSRSIFTLRMGWGLDPSPSFAKAWLASSTNNSHSLFWHKYGPTGVAFICLNKVHQKIDVLDGILNKCGTGKTATSHKLSRILEIHIDFILLIKYSFLPAKVGIIFNQRIIQDCFFLMNRVYFATSSLNYSWNISNISLPHGAFFFLERTWLKEYTKDKYMIMTCDWNINWAVRKQSV